MNVNRQTLYLSIPIIRGQNEVIYFHAAPMPEDMRQKFASDLLRAFVTVTGMDVDTAMHGFTEFVYESMESRLDDARANIRKEAYQLAMQSNFLNGGHVICQEGKFLPVSVGSALDAGLIDETELNAAMSQYGFFSEALRSPGPWRSTVTASVTTKMTRSDFATSAKRDYDSRLTQSDLITYAPASQEIETGAQAETPPCTDSMNNTAPSTEKDSASSTVLQSVTGFQ